MSDKFSAVTNNTFNIHMTHLNLKIVPINKSFLIARHNFTFVITIAHIQKPKCAKLQSGF
jgi:hypothetical protein